MFPVAKPFAQTHHVFTALFKILRREFHHRILQQRQMTDNAVIAPYGIRNDKRFGKTHNDGLAINAAVMDTRIKATVSSTMGAFDPYDSGQRAAMREQLNRQRTDDLRKGVAAERSR